MASLQLSSHFLGTNTTKHNSISISHNYSQTPFTRLFSCKVCFLSVSFFCCVLIFSEGHHCLIIWEMSLDKIVEVYVVFHVYEWMRGRFQDATWYNRDKNYGGCFISDSSHWETNLRRLWAKISTSAVFLRRCPDTGTWLSSVSVSERSDIATWSFRIGLWEHLYP